jgi:hypothetical protein
VPISPLRAISKGSSRSRSSAEGGNLFADVVHVAGGLDVARLAPLVVDAEVHADAIDPGVEARVALELVEALVGLGEGVLHDVQSVLAIAEHADGERGDLSLITFDQHPEGLPITPAGALDERPRRVNRAIV